MKYKFQKLLRNNEKVYSQIIPKPIDEGFVVVGDLIVGKTRGIWIAYDRTCDHNGGTLNLDKNKKTATCPLHKWTLKLDESVYENNCHKTSYEVTENREYLQIRRSNFEFENIFSGELVDKEIDLKFNAHASVTIEIDGVSLTSDPWFIGSCFATGWWHSNPPSKEAFNRLENSNYIYISHNHPDHLHIPTLERFVSKDTAIIVPNFESKSVESILLKSGFKNLIVVDFLQEVDVKTNTGNFRLVLVKSGDDRDDSSLLLITKENKIFLGVDTNMPNKWILPKVDLLYTPFAAGASGFPARIDNFSLSEKNHIIHKNRLSIFHNHVKKLVSSLNPNFVIPYAGYFTESSRDIDVKEINLKNSPDDLIRYVENEFNDIKGINPLKNPHISLYKKELSISPLTEDPSYFVDEEYEKEEIGILAGSYLEISDAFLQALGNQFINSNFYDDLTVIFVPCDAFINNPVSSALLVDFSSSNRSYTVIEPDKLNNNDIVKNQKNNIEILKVRADSFLWALENGVPLEDLSIGFQTKMFRSPNVYNFKFWNHFTNNQFIKLAIV